MSKNSRPLGCTTHNSAAPVSDRVYDALRKQTADDKHRKALANIKPTIDNRPPSSLQSGPARKQGASKRDYLMEQKCNKIQDENMRLLDRLNRIATVNPLVSARVTGALHPANMVDNSEPNRGPLAAGKSSRRIAQEREALSIRQENAHLLQRITSVRSEFDSRAFEEHRAQHEQHMAMLSRKNSALSIASRMGSRAPSRGASNVGTREGTPSRGGMGTPDGGTRGVHVGMPAWNSGVGSAAPPLYQEYAGGYMYGGAGGMAGLPPMVPSVLGRRGGAE